MRILLAHNYYQQPGGEDRVFEAECALLESRGHEVVRFVLHNDAVEGLSAARLVAHTFWNRATYRAVYDLVSRRRIQIAHFHNTLPLISPAAFHAARAAGAAVVHTLHNYRLACPGATLFRAGRTCDACVGRSFAWPAIIHGCYRGSRGASGVVAFMVALHRALGTWRRFVDAYITPSQAARRVLLRGGLPPAKVLVRANFIYPSPSPGDGSGGYALFVGRLSAEKGIRTLLDAWRIVGSDVSLKIVGDGPLAELVHSAAVPGVEWLGRQPPQAVGQLMSRAAVVVVPSVCQETFGMTAVESLARGTPVIASRIGALAEIVDHGRTGLLVEPGSAEGLAAAVRRLASDARTSAAMRTAARGVFEAAYGPEPAYAGIMKIYGRLAAERSAYKS